MSIYGEREKAAYGNFQSRPGNSQNPFILAWWKPSHDGLLRDRIMKDHWVWYWSITEDILRITENSIIEGWKRQDPLCRRYAWYNILMYFAASRAEQLGLTALIRPVQRKICVRCEQPFVEDSLPVPIIRRLGIERLEFCAPCATGALFNTGEMSASKDAAIDYLKRLAILLQRIPAQDFGSGMDDIIDLTTDERLEVFRLLLKKPSLRRVKQLFGSWLNALIQAGVLENGTRPTTRGIQCLAKDGHVCLSLAEKTIDDFLFSRGIPHERETKYPEGNFRTDFTVKGVFVEYFGLIGDGGYEAKMELKIGICKKHGVRLISLFAADVASVRRLEEKLSGLL